jgi:hypothetical protein
MYNKTTQNLLHRNGDGKMEDFVAMIKQQNGYKESIGEDCKSNGFRKILASIASASSDIKIIIHDIQHDDKGKITFTVNRRDLSISYDTLVKYKDQIFTSMMINFIGELLVREHINEFVKSLTDFDGDDYDIVVNSHDHRSFGIHTDSGEYFVFSFHASLIQNILAERFDRQIKREQKVKKEQKSAKQK